MKLYATTTSERASKGQGGNEYINIDIQVEQDDGTRIGLCQIEVKRVINRDYLHQNDYEASCLHNFERNIIASVPYGMERYLKAIKGEKQKGAVHTHEHEPMNLCYKCGQCPLCSKPCVH